MKPISYKQEMAGGWGHGEDLFQGGPHRILLHFSQMKSLDLTLAGVLGG